MQRVRAAGPDGFQSPCGGNRAAVVAISAWHRTAESLKRRGMIKTRTNGSMFWATQVTP